jgi:hypothetical protein
MKDVLGVVVYDGRVARNLLEEMKKKLKNGWW